MISPILPIKETSQHKRLTGLNKVINRSRRYQYSVSRLVSCKESVNDETAIPSTLETCYTSEGDSVVHSGALNSVGKRCHSLQSDADKVSIANPFSKSRKKQNAVGARV